MTCFRKSRPGFEIQQCRHVIQLKYQTAQQLQDHRKNPRQLATLLVDNLIPVCFLVFKMWIKIVIRHIMLNVYFKKMIA